MDRTSLECTISMIDTVSSALIGLIGRTRTVSVSVLVRRFSLNSCLLGSDRWAWTLHESQPIGRVPSGGPMASFSWGVRQENGRPLLFHILTSGQEGVHVHWYDGITSSWQARQQPEAFQNIDPYSPLAANGDRHVYALEAGSVREFVVSEDGLAWSLVGDVPTKDS